MSELEAVTSDAPAIPTAPARTARRREAALLAVLAIAGAVIEYPLAFALKSIDRSDLARALPFLGVTVVMAALIPLSLRLSARARIARCATARGKDRGREIALLDSQPATRLDWLRVPGCPRRRERAGTRDRAAGVDSAWRCRPQVAEYADDDGGARPHRVRRSIGRNRGGSQRRNPVSICALRDLRMDAAADVARLARSSGTPRAVGCDHSAGLPVRIDSPGSTGRDDVP